MSVKKLRRTSPSYPLRAPRALLAGRRPPASGRRASRRDPAPSPPLPGYSVELTGHADSQRACREVFGVGGRGSPSVKEAATARQAAPLTPAMSSKFWSTWKTGARDLSGCCNEQVRDRRCPVMTLISEESWDLQRSVIDRRRWILGRHRRARWMPARRAKVSSGLRRVSDLKSGHGHWWGRQEAALAVG